MKNCQRLIPPSGCGHGCSLLRSISSVQFSIHKQRPSRHNVIAMKTKLQLFGVGMIAALLAGCVVQSINPLLTEKEYISYPSLVGTKVNLFKCFLPTAWRDQRAGGAADRA